jgi:hypothetical protein
MTEPRRFPAALVRRGDGSACFIRDLKVASNPTLRLTRHPGI